MSDVWEVSLRDIQRDWTLCKNGATSYWFTQNDITGVGDTIGVEEVLEMGASLEENVEMLQSAVLQMRDMILELREDVGELQYKEDARESMALAIRNMQERLLDE